VSGGEHDGDCDAGRRVHEAEILYPDPRGGPPTLMLPRCCYECHDAVGPAGCVWMFEDGEYQAHCRGCAAGYDCDRQRHLICVPYSIDGLHAMAAALGIKRRWFDRDHYDIPRRRVAELAARCRVVPQREIVRIITNATGTKRRTHARKG